MQNECQVEENTVLKRRGGQADNRVLNCPFLITIVIASFMTTPFILSHAMKCEDFLPEAKVVEICTPTCLMMRRDSVRIIVSSCKEKNMN